MRLRIGLVVLGWLLISGMTALLFSWPVAGVLIGVGLILAGLFSEGAE